MVKNSSTNEEEIIRKYSSTVYRIAYSVTSNRADSDDIYQNVFLRYIRKSLILTMKHTKKHGLSK